MDLFRSNPFRGFQMARGICEHRWTDKDDIVALYLSRFRNDLLPMEQIVERLGMSLGAMNGRIGNHRSLAGNANWDHASKRTRMIYALHCQKPQAELRQLALTALQS